MKKRGLVREKSVRIKQLNSIMAYAAALMLAGVPPVICESVLDEVYCSVKKSIVRIKL